MSELALEKMSDTLLKEHQWLVHVIANGFKRRMPANIELDDLVSWGNIGLLDAIEKWDPKHEVAFKSYADYRIRGNILDELRKAGSYMLSRDGQDKAKLLENISREIQFETGIKSSDYTIAARLNMTIDELHQMRMKARTREVLSLEATELFTRRDREMVLISNINNGGDLLEKIEAMRKLERFVLGHKMAARAAFILYNVWGLDLKEIGEVLGFSQSRASQLVSKVRLGIREDQE